jgi:branched-chain amino acid transport system substrate-binding protein
VQAWVAHINARGGVNCHPVKYIVADDGGDPARNQALTQQLVEQNQVLAFVQMDAPLGGQASVGYLTQKQIPVIGDEGGEQWFYQSPMYFPQATQANPLIASTIAAAGDFGRAKGMTKLGAISCIEASACSSIYAFLPQYASKFGLDLVYRGQVSIAQPDYTANCQAAHAANAQIFWYGLDPNSIERAARSCTSINYHPLPFAASSTVVVGMATDPDLDGMGFAMQVLPWMITSNPGIVQYQNALRQYAPGLQPDGGTIVGWVSAKLFELATTNLPDPPTSQGVLDGLWQIKNNDLGGLTQPLTFTKGQAAPQVECYWLAQLKGGQFLSPDGAQRHCL